MELLEEKYNLINVTKEEQDSLCVNVLSISPGKVVAGKGCLRIIKRLQDLGLHVYEIDFSEIIKTGGSFRCGILPLYRNSKINQNK